MLAQEIYSIKSLEKQEQVQIKRRRLAIWVKILGPATHCQQETHLKGKDTETWVMSRNLKIEDNGSNKPKLKASWNTYFS